MNLETSIELLKNVMKHSNALDEFRHIDLSLVANTERLKYQKALVFIQNLIDEGDMSKDDVLKLLEVK